MERIRDSRRASCSSSSNSPTGLPFKRRPTSDTTEEDGQVGLLKETLRLRDRAARKEQERERLRELLNRGKRKRRRLNGDKLLASPSNGGFLDPVDGCQIVHTTSFLRCHGRTLQSKPCGSLPPPALCAHVPRKPRSVGNRRTGKSWRSTVFDANSKQQSVKPMVSGSKLSPLSGQNEIEIEIAEVLYGLKKQHSPSDGPSIDELQKMPVKNEENQLVSDQDHGVGNATKDHTVEMGALQVAPVTVEMSSEPLTRDLGIDGDKKAVVKQETSAVQEESLVCSESTRNCADLAASELVSAVAVETNSNQPGKLVIDLMVPPPMELSCEADGAERLASDPTIVEKDVEMSLKFDKGAEAQSFPVEELIDDMKGTRKMVIKGELQSRDLEELDQTNSELKQKLNASIQSAQFSSSRMPLDLTQSPTCPLKGMDIRPGRDEDHMPVASVKPLDCLPTQSRPKRCATHHYIACNIYRHQQGLAMKSFCPEIANQSLSHCAKPDNFSKLLSLGSTYASPSLGGNLSLVKDGGLDIESYSGTNGGQTKRAADTAKNTTQKHLASHQIPVPLLPGQRMNQPMMANPSGFLISASSTINVRSSYPNGAPFLAVLPRNVPSLNGENIQSTSGGKVPPQQMHITDGKFHPSQVVLPIQIQQRRNLASTQAFASLTDVRTSSCQRNWNSESLFPGQSLNEEYNSKSGEKSHSVSSFAFASSNQSRRYASLSFPVAQNLAVHGVKQRTYQIPQKINGSYGGGPTNTNGERKLGVSDAATCIEQSSCIYNSKLQLPMAVQNALSARIYPSNGTPVGAHQNKPTPVQLQNQQQQILQTMAASQQKVRPTVNDFCSPSPAAKLSNDFKSSCSSKSRVSDINQASEVFPASALPFCNSALNSLSRQKLSVPQSQIRMSFGTNS